MKNKPFTLTILALLLIVIATAGMRAQTALASGPAQVDGDLPECPICDVPAGYDGPLTDTEVYGLLLALNDEYHAAAVYGQVLEDFGTVRPFASIEQSEQQHITAVLALFERYGVPVPANPWPGDVPRFESVTAACDAGVTAELVNRDLYDVLYATTDRADIELVYQALQRASEENHLPAFERCAAGGGMGPGGAPGGGNGVGGGIGGPGNGNGRGRGR